MKRSIVGPTESTEAGKGFLYTKGTVYTVLIGLIAGSYLVKSDNLEEWLPWKWKEAELDKLRKEQWVQSVDSNFDRLFENAKNFEDSLKISNQYNIPYQLTLKPSFEDKERVYLEGRVE
jgi:hypothetical protein